MDQKHLDHAYHRSRVDAQILGMITLVTIVAVLALTLSDRFQPFEPGAKWWEPVRLIWLEKQQSWLPEKTLIDTNDFPPSQNLSNVITAQQIYPRSTCLVLVIGVLAVAHFTYRCARRQTNLMNSVFGDHASASYQRPWEEIRVTFWALNATLLFLLFFMMR